MENMKTKYQNTVVKEMKKNFGYKNVMAVPRIEKVVVNSGFGKLISAKTGDDLKKTLAAIQADLSVICGQHATLTKAKLSISGFKLREGMPIGAKVTLRGKRMYDFLDRLLNVVLPRSRDFQGLNPAAVDQGGNFTIGMREHIFFPEISPERAKDIIGLEVTITTTASTKEEGLKLLRALGFPFKKES